MKSFDPRPSRAHPEHRAKRLAIEREHPAFNNKDGYYKAGLLALMAGIALFPWEKKHQEHEEKIRREERQNQQEDSRRRRSHDDRPRDEYERDDRRRSADGERRRDHYQYGDRRSKRRDYDFGYYDDDSKSESRHSTHSHSGSSSTGGMRDVEYLSIQDSRRYLDDYKR
ncbi:hypothetical protein PVAG01_01805 [Phlyctema vagabunda]|uniref:Uncharacterized protein n=1 Tax=Phlyctema vagabunda TaxID=108571 RepID=A0ABR4PY78_9HELO